MINTDFALVINNLNDNYKNLNDYIKRVTEENHLKAPCVIPFKEDGILIDLLIENMNFNVFEIVKDIFYIASKLGIKKMAFFKNNLALPEFKWIELLKNIEKVSLDYKIEVLISN